MEAFVEKESHNADQVLNLLKMQHQSSYLHFINGLENALDIYLEHRSDQNFAKIKNAIDSFNNKQSIFNMLGNGYYLN